MISVITPAPTTIPPSTSHTHRCSSSSNFHPFDVSLGLSHPHTPPPPISHLLSTLLHPHSSESSFQHTLRSLSSDLWPFTTLCPPSTHTLGQICNPCHWFSSQPGNHRGSIFYFKQETARRMVMFLLAEMPHNAYVCKDYVESTDRR